LFFWVSGISFEKIEQVSKFIILYFELYLYNSVLDFLIASLLKVPTYIVEFVYYYFSFCFSAIAIRKIVLNTFE
jgi:hypothetical protein